MRQLHDEHHGTKACNDTDSCPTLRTRVRGIYLTAPLDAQAGTEVQIGLLGPPAANTGKFTVRAVATIITLWPRQEGLSNSWKINGRIGVYYMGFLATLC
jgi:hypothetical protein